MIRSSTTPRGERIRIPVELHYESGAHTFFATVEWFITKIPNATGNT